jgi:uncharacterized protein (DUF302 family)
VNKFRINYTVKLQMRYTLFTKIQRVMEEWGMKGLQVALLTSAEELLEEGAGCKCGVLGF